MDKISPTKWGWLKQKEVAQCAWVLKYLRRKMLVPITTGTPDYRTITSLFESWPNDAEHREKLNQTKRAWKTHKTREAQVDSKQYNFTLPTRVKKHLDALAKQTNQTINKTLEMLIEERYEGSKTAKPKATIKVKKANNAPSQSNPIAENESRVVAAEAEKTNTPLPQSSPITEDKNGLAAREAEETHSLLPNDTPLTENKTELIDIAGERTNNPLPQDCALTEDEIGIKAEEIDTPVESTAQNNTAPTSPDVPEDGESRDQITQGPPASEGSVNVGDRVLSTMLAALTELTLKNRFK